MTTTDIVPVGDTAAASAAAPAKAAVYTFGEPASVLDRREIGQYVEMWHNGRWYEPPLPMGKLAQTFNMSPYHRSAIALKVNLLVAQQIATAWLSSDAFERFALDFLQMGNGYLEWVPNVAGRLARADHAPALNLRPGLEPGKFWFVNGPLGDIHEFDVGRIFQLQQPDVMQEIFGMPEWLAALQAGLLSENATLFRRRYYLNGAHAGFVFYLSEQLADQETADALADRLGQAKGIGNFKNMFVNIPGGKKDGIQIMPIADVTAKDEFSNVKTLSRDDMLAAHRTPPQLIGIVPTNNGGFGKVTEARDAFYETEIVPIARRMLRMNEWFGVPLLAFADYVCTDGSVIRQEGSSFRKVLAGSR